MRSALFICTGNTCRSPMAEGIAKAWIETSGADLFAGSAGVAAVDGMDTSPETLAVLERLGIGFEGRSKGLSRDMVLKADALFCMTASHQAAARLLVHDDEAAQAKQRAAQKANECDMTNQHVKFLTRDVYNVRKEDSPDAIARFVARMQAPLAYAYVM